MCEIQLGTMHSIEFILALIAPPPPPKQNKTRLNNYSFIKNKQVEDIEKKRLTSPIFIISFFSKTAFVTFILEKERLGEGRWG